MSAAPIRSTLLRAGLPCAALLLAACTGQQSALNPAAPQAQGLATLSWWVFGAATLVTLGVVVSLAIAVLLAAGKRPERPRDEKFGVYMVVGGGIILPTVAAIALLYTSALLGHQSPGSRPPADAMKVQVIGHRWWWEVHYLDARGVRIASLANELVVPVGRPVAVELQSNDVIHSFWAPNLQGKKDMIPGRPTDAWFTVNRPGIYRGQCAEFCGAQHALMAFYVVAVDEAEFQTWLANQAAPAREPASDLARRGQQVFETNACMMCHAVRGTSAMATVAPDLTHIASRQSLAAGALPNRRAQMAAWILDPQQVKPGSLMPATPLSGDDLQALLAYLDGLL
jgi:cytochrome c oxidase subunit II